jgi:hypothetical protein
MFSFVHSQIFVHFYWHECQLIHSLLTAPSLHHSSYQTIHKMHFKIENVTVTHSTWKDPMILFPYWNVEKENVSCFVDVVVKHNKKESMESDLFVILYRTQTHLCSYSHPHTLLLCLGLVTKTIWETVHNGLCWKRSSQLCLFSQIQWRSRTYYRCRCKTAKAIKRTRRRSTEWIHSFGECLTSVRNISS